MRNYLILAASLAATTVQAQTLPPVRPLGATVARSTEQMTAVTTAVPLPGGKVLVNDILKRRVLLFDSTLSQVTVVADSTGSTANAYGARPGGLISYRGDSALFIDPASLSMLVINSEGKITRVMSAPRPQDVMALVGGATGFPGFDAAGKLVYRAPPRMRMAGMPGAPRARRPCACYGRASFAWTFFASGRPYWGSRRECGETVRSQSSRRTALSASQRRSVSGSHAHGPRFRSAPQRGQSPLQSSRQSANAGAASNAG